MNPPDRNWSIHLLEILLLRMTQNQSTLENLPRTIQVDQMIQNHQILLQNLNNYLLELIENRNQDSGVEDDRLSQ